MAEPSVTLATEKTTHFSGLVIVVNVGPSSREESVFTNRAFARLCFAQRPQLFVSHSVYSQAPQMTMTRILFLVFLAIKSVSRPYLFLILLIINGAQEPSPLSIRFVPFRIGDFSRCLGPLEIGGGVFGILVAHDFGLPELMRPSDSALTTAGAWTSPEAMRMRMPAMTGITIVPSCHGSNFCAENIGISARRT